MNYSKNILFSVMCAVLLRSNQGKTWCIHYYCWVKVEFWSRDQVKAEVSLASRFANVESYHCVSCMARSKKLLKVKERVEKELRSEKKKFDTNNEDQIAIIEDVLNSIDSGASNHATSWRKLFVSYTLDDYGHVRIRNMFF